MLLSTENTIHIWKEYKHIVLRLVTFAAIIAVALIIMRTNSSIQADIWSNIYLKSHIVAKHDKICRSIQILETINNTYSRYSSLSNITKINILYSTVPNKKTLKKIEDTYLFIEQRNHFERYIKELTTIINAWNDTDKILKKSILKKLIFIKKSHSMWRVNTLEILGISAVKLSKLEKTRGIHDDISSNNISFNDIDVVMKAIYTIIRGM